MGTSPAGPPGWLDVWKGLGAGNTRGEEKAKEGFTTTCSYLLGRCRGDTLDVTSDGQKTREIVISYPKLPQNMALSCLVCLAV